MLSIEEIKQRLKHRNLKAVAEHTDISYFTICNIAKGLHKRPHKTTLVVLSNYFEENP